ncbi:MAG: cytidylate kinase-like family protein [Clostridiales bacterium]|nr:cytidylate kinase-like family protein [Candidatus Blautia equi]
MIITISREYGAGGHSIGKKVAEALGIEIYDKDIVRETVASSGLEEQLVKKEEEERSTAENIWRIISSYSGPTYNDTQDEIHELQKAIILKFAKKGPCVVIGRCADVILKEAGFETLNVFIYADDVHCAMRASEMNDMKNATELKKLMDKKNASRQAYYHHYTGKKWGDARNYDLALNSGTLGYDQCVKMIVDAYNNAQ